MSTPPRDPGARSDRTATTEPAAGGAPAPAPALGPSYRQRLRLEGGTLAGCGLVASLALVLIDDRTTDNGLSTVLQLAVVLLLLAWFGPRSVHKALARARPAGELDPTGEPTPLWQLPLIVAGLATPFLLFGVWDAGLRVTGGCLLVGLAQAILLERVVARQEQAAGRVYVRAPGSRLLRGTQLAWAPAGLAGSPADGSAQRPS